MQPQKHITQDQNQDLDSVLHSFMGWLGDRFQQSAKDADESQSYLNIGLKTQFAQEWETFLKNPIESMYSTRQHIDTTLFKFINGMVSTYLKSKGQLIDRVLLSDTTKNNMYYCISLKEDTLENRIEINDFFDFYESNSLSASFPIYFQFVPQKYISNIKYKESIV